MLKLEKFLRDESGAVTVDFVALAAGVGILGMACAYSIFGNGVQPALDSVNNELATVEVGVDFAPVPDFGS